MAVLNGRLTLPPRDKQKRDISGLEQDGSEMGSARECSSVFAMGIAQVPCGVVNPEREGRVML